MGWWEASVRVKRQNDSFRTGPKWFKNYVLQKRPVGVLLDVLLARFEAYLGSLDSSLQIP